MSERRGRRKANHTAAFESLEGRELLSTAHLPLGLAGGRAAMMAGARAARAAMLQALRAARGGTSVIPAPGAVASGQVVPQTVNNPLQPSGQISIPENHMALSPSALTGLAALSAGRPLTFPSYSFRPNVLRSQYTPITLPDGTTALGKTTTPLPLSATTTTTTPAATTPATATPVVATTPTNPPGPGTATPAGTTTVAVAAPAQATPGAIGAAPVSGLAPVMPPGTLGLPGNVTLSAGDVATLKTAVETFASSYTSGKDPAADKAAVTALKADLQSLAQGVWSETHVAARADVAALQKAVNAFAASYTSGANPAKDVAAWQALRTAATNFGHALKNPNAPAAATTPAAGTTSPADPGTPPPGLMVGGMAAPGLDGIAGALLNGPALTSDEVNGLKSAVETFASSYTSGANPAADKAALTALQTSLGTLAANHWKSVVLAPPPAVPGTSAATAQAPTPAAAPMVGYAATVAPVSAPATNPDGTPTGKG